MPGNNHHDDNLPRLNRFTGRIKDCQERDFSLDAQGAEWEGAIIDLSFLRDHKKVFYVFGYNVIFRLPSLEDSELQMIEGKQTKPDAGGSLPDGWSPERKHHRGDYYKDNYNRAHPGMPPTKVGTHGFKFSFVYNYLGGSGTTGGPIVVQTKYEEHNLLGSVYDHDEGVKSSNLSDGEVALSYGGGITAGFTHVWDRIDFEFINPREQNPVWRWSGAVTNARAIVFYNELQELQEN